MSNIIFTSPRHFFATWVWRNILCRLSIHKWEIGSLVDKKGRLVNYERTCNCCEKTQRLEKPKDYHPTKYIWVNFNHSNTH